VGECKPLPVGRAHGRRGRAVQVEPINTVLNAPGTKRLKLKHDKLLSSFAFNINLRRYTAGGQAKDAATKPQVGGAYCPYQTHLESAWNQALETEL
jgi:hypothetical protein